MTGTDYISIRWTGKLKPQFSETYTFSVTSDDGVRLWVDGTQLVDRWDTTVNNSQATIQLVADAYYDIKMEYKEVAGRANVQLSWASQSVQKEIVPAKFFYYQSHIKGSPFTLTVQPGGLISLKSSFSKNFFDKVSLVLGLVLHQVPASLPQPQGRSLASRSK